MNRSVESVICMVFGLLFALTMGLAVAVSFYMDGMCFKSLLMLVVWLVATCFLWSMPFILQRIRSNKEVFVDERDLAIFKNAALAAHTISWLYFLSACFVGWWAVGSTGSVSVNVIPLIFVGWVVIYQFAHIFSSLILDRYGGKYGES